MHDLKNIYNDSLMAETFGTFLSHIVAPIDITHCRYMKNLIHAAPLTY